MGDAGPAEVIHVAGPTITVGSIRRQRCQWCGALIQEYDLARLSRPLEPGEDPESPEPWEPGRWTGLVAISGTFPVMSRAVPEPEDGKVPEGSCMALDEEVTR